MRKIITALLILSSGVGFSQTWQQLPYYYDRGQGFLPVTPKIFASPNDVLVAGIKGTSASASGSGATLESHISMDGGATWQHIFSGKPIISAEFGPDGTIYFISSKEYLTSGNFFMDTLFTSVNGTNWTNSGHKLIGGNKQFTEYNFVISDNNTLLFPNHMGGSGGIYLSASIDNGVSWTPTTIGASPVSCSQTTDTIIQSFSSPWPGGIMYSHDGGATVSVASGINAESYPIRLPNGDIYAATLGIFYKSTDGGATFTQIAAPSSFGHVQEFLYASNGKFYIRVSGAVKGIWETSDFVTFNAVSATLPDGNLVNDIDVSNNYLYAITDTNLYKLELSGSSTSITDNEITEIITIYPNPAKEYISINSSVGGNTVVEIYNLQGKMMMNNTILVEKNNTFSMVLPKLVSGLYFVRFINEDGKIQQHKIIIE